MNVIGYLTQVLYKEDVSKRTDVNKKDFFLNVFKEICSPESQLLMYNESNTMSWFPTKVRQILFYTRSLC